MGWKSRYIRSLVSSPKAPRPRPGTTTIAGFAHRLRWIDKHVGYRMGCTCGWIDATRRGSESKAIEVANDHLLNLQKELARRSAAAQKAQRQAEIRSWTPAQRRRYRAWQAFLVAILIASVGTGAGVLVAINNHSPSYNDGYNWALNNTGPLAGSPPGCAKKFMVSKGSVSYVNGANEPHDNYQQWRDGCEAQLNGD